MVLQITLRATMAAVSPLPLMGINLRSGETRTGDMSVTVPIDRLALLFHLNKLLLSPSISALNLNLSTITTRIPLSLSAVHRTQLKIMDRASRSGGFTLIKMIRETLMSVNMGDMITFHNTLTQRHTEATQLMLMIE